MNSEVKKVIDALTRLRDQRVPLIFASCEQVNEKDVSVSSAFGGSYEEGILMIGTLVTQMHEVTGSSYFEILTDLGNQLSNSEILDRQDLSKSFEEEVTEEEVKKKVISLKGKNGKKPNK